MINELLKELEIVSEVELVLRNKIAEAEISKKRYESNLWLTTNFNKELEGKKNVTETRDALITHKMATEFIDKAPTMKNELNYIKRYIEILNFKIETIMKYGLDVIKTDVECNIKGTCQEIIDEYRENDNH